MREKLSIYVTYVKIFFKSRSEYRVAFIAGIFANLFCYLVTFCLFGLLPTVSGILQDGISQICLFYMGLIYLPIPLRVL